MPSNNNLSPSSPRPIQVDPPPRSHAIQISSPNALSPPRPIGNAPPIHRGTSGGGGVGRSYRDDPEGARERQMQQDIESAMSMSRARSGSVHDKSPAVRPSGMHFPSTSPIEEGHFPMLSDHEEAEMDRARSSGFRVHDDAGSDDGHHYPDHHEESDRHDEERGEGMMNVARGSKSSGYDSHARLLPDGRGERGPVMGKQIYDFGAMEIFAADERGRLDRAADSAGVGSWILNGEGVRRRGVAIQGRPNDEQHRQEHPGSYETALERTHTTSVFGDDDRDDTHPPGSAFSPKESESGITGFHRRRQRKLSQSNPVQRRQGKLAIFEGFGTQGGNDVPDTASPAGAFKAPRQPKNLNPPSSGGFVPFTDAAPGHDRPYRFSFYSNSLPVTIHARTLAELPAEGQSFEDLFRGRNNNDDIRPAGPGTDYGSVKGDMTPHVPVKADEPGPEGKISLLARAAGAAVSTQTPALRGGARTEEEPDSSTWWLDVLSPTDEEMRMLSKVFGIHPLTTEDILLEETREKIELFRNYYLVCFRSFDQDPYSQTYLEPLNMYIIVFREGTLSFHFRGTSHPQNVRRRIKHLKDYISVTSDWISYALIDDITDAFGPLIQSIEYEVDSIDELVLILKEAEQSDMLRRIGTCRKKVMGLLRLMGNKADVVKGLAKRCNEQWLVAPKSDIGLYLSDIQDHLITMTQNLNHYEKILSRSHSNYLAQISIEMTDANNQINDVLSKLTALGTVLIPMNLVTGLWGMNVHVPGQDIETGYAWFGGILGCLALFAVLGAFATWKCFVR